MKATVIKLTDSTLDFLKKLNFPELPENAKYIAFTEDGDAHPLEDLEFPVGHTMPKFAFMSYYEVDNLELK